MADVAREFALVVLLCVCRFQGRVRGKVHEGAVGKEGVVCCLRGQGKGRCECGGGCLRLVNTRTPSEVIMMAQNHWLSIKFIEHK
jgi:hypothetical protein